MKSFSLDLVPILTLSSVVLFCGLLVGGMYFFCIRSTLQSAAPASPNYVTISAPVATISPNTSGNYVDLSGAVVFSKLNKKALLGEWLEVERSDLVDETFLGKHKVKMLASVVEVPCCLNSQAAAEGKSETHTIRFKYHYVDIDCAEIKFGSIKLSISV